MNGICRASIALLAVGVLLAACGEADPVSTSGAPGTSSEPTEEATPPSEPPQNQPLEPGDLEAPPPVTVHYFDRSIDLHAWTYCYRNGCADGAPPENPFDVGSPEEIVVEFPLDDWRFSASFETANDECPRAQRVHLEEQSDGTFVLRPAGYAGTYDVTLEGRGEGDLYTTFRWTTTSDGPLPKPKAHVGVLAGHDGAVDSYGVELSLTNLAETPKDVSASITVRASNGESLTIEPNLRRRGCTREGSVLWDGPDAPGLAAAKLGDPPFTYDVELMLDGETYRATATWPDDEIPGFGPYVRLLFDPPLPALS